jgi:signal transduction histidine kinase
LERTAGLSWLEGDTVTNYGPEYGFPPQGILQILEDDSGRLWMSQKTGVLRANKSELNAAIRTRAYEVTIVRYGKADGIRSGSCNGGAQPAGCKTKDGRLWFRTDRGVAVVDPAHLRPEPGLEPLIEQVSLDRRPVTPLNPVDRVEVPAGRHDVEIQYTASSFRAPGKVRFRYRLSGFDAGWVEAGTRRTAYYTNLPPGRYRFEVIAANGDGIWSRTTPALGLRQKPQFYQTWGFLILCATTFIALVLLGMHLRVSHIRSGLAAILAERMQISREIHDTLAQGFAAISIHLQSVEEAWIAEPTAARRHLEVAQGLSRENRAQARTFMRELRTDSEDGDDLGRSILGMVERLARGSAARTDVRITGRPGHVDPNVAHNLLRITQEAVTNALRHSGARRVCIAVNFSRTQVHLHVNDDGAGFDVGSRDNEKLAHFGLVGIKERIEKIGGSLAITSTRGGGAEIHASAPRRQGRQRSLRERDCYERCY